MIGADNINLPFLEAMITGIVLSPFALTFSSWLMIKAFKLKGSGFWRVFWPNLITVVAGIAVTYLLIISFNLTAIGSSSYLSMAPIVLVPICWYLIHSLLLWWLVGISWRESLKVSVLSLGIASIAIYVIVWLIMFSYMILFSFY